MMRRKPDGTAWTEREYAQDLVIERCVWAINERLAKVGMNREKLIKSLEGDGFTATEIDQAKIRFAEMMRGEAREALAQKEARE